MRLCVILVLLIWTSCSEGICDQAVIMVNGVVLRRLTIFFSSFVLKTGQIFSMFMLYRTLMTVCHVLNDFGEFLLLFYP